MKIEEIGNSPPIPTMEEVETANRDQLCIWHRFLSRPRTPPSKINIYNRIEERFFRENGGYMSDEIHNKMGWDYKLFKKKEVMLNGRHK